MKIAFFSDNFYPELSGISDSISLLAKGLEKCGHAVIFFVPYYGPKEFEKASLPPAEIPLGERIQVRRLFSIPFSTPTEQGRLVIPTVRPSIALQKWNPDIIHTQLFFGAGLQALCLAKMLQKPLVGTNHTLLKEFLRYSPIKSGWVGCLSLKYASWYYNCCDFVTAPSQYVIQEMKFHGLRKPFEVISNPVDTEIFTPREIDRDAVKKSYGLSNNTLVYAGRLAGEKNIDVIFQAMVLIKKEIPNITLALAGRGIAASELKNLARKFQIEDSVKFLGMLSKPQLAELFTASEVFVITSTSETQSLTLMQAMAVGLPVLGVEARALPEYINEKNGFLVKVNDYQSLAHRTIFLMQNPGLRKQMGREAWQFVQNFSAPCIVKKWETLYKKIQSEKKP